MKSIGFEDYSGKLYAYSSIVVLIQAVALFLAFLHSKQCVGKVKTGICFVAKHSFSVYIIHFAMWDVLFTTILGIDKWIGNTILGTVAITLAVLVIFVFCVILDFIKNKIEQRIFNRFARSRVSQWYNGVMDKWDLIVNA